MKKFGVWYTTSKGKSRKGTLFDNIKIVFTKEYETADNYIEKFVHRLGNTYTIRVAASDYLEQTMILSSGGVRMPPRELRDELEAAASDKKPVLFPNKVKKCHRVPYQARFIGKA